MSEVKQALKGYWDAVQSSDLAQTTQADYFDKANNFVRWMNGNFTPGSKKEPYRRKPDRVKEEERRLAVIRPKQIG